MENEIVFAGIEWIHAGGIILCTLGVALLIAEIFVPAFGLFGLAGLAAVLVGVVQLHLTGYIVELPIAVGWLIFFAVLALAAAIAGGLYTYKLYKKKMQTGIEGMVGDTGRVIEWDGQKGRIFVQGENWEAYSEEPLTMQKDDRVTIAKVEGMKVKVIPKNPEAFVKNKEGFV